jgi:GNAT superfamily N-acetyltransferase
MAMAAAAERPTMTIDRDHFERYTDHVRLRSGLVLTLRFATLADAVRLSDYFRGLSAASRYNRLMGAAPELPQTQLAKFVAIGEDDAYTVLASIASDNGESLVGELRYALHSSECRVEFGVSVDDHWHGLGIGAALLSTLQCRAAALGASLLYGDTLRSNAAMIALARGSGYRIGRFAPDWRQIRLEKPIAEPPQLIPCASWRLAMIRSRSGAAAS